jgi:hypothetical protein
MEDKHTSQLCRVKLLDREVQAREAEVPVKGSGVQAKGTEVLVKVIGIDGKD